MQNNIDCTSFISDIIEEDKDLHISFYSEESEQVIGDAIRKFVNADQEFHLSSTKGHIGLFTVHFEDPKTAVNVRSILISQDWCVVGQFL